MTFDCKRKLKLTSSLYAGLNTFLNLTSPFLSSHASRKPDLNLASLVMDLIGLL